MDQGSGKPGEVLTGPPLAAEPDAPLRFSLFHDYRWTLLTETVARGRPFRLEPGATLVRAGDAISDIYYVERGELEVSLRSRSGQAKIVQIMPQGSMFGELQLYADMATSPVTVRTSVRTLLRVTPYETIRCLAGRDPELTANLMASMSRKALSFLRQVEDLISRTASERVACLLQAMFAATESADLSLEIAQETIAALVGAHRVTVTVALQELEAAGIIGVGRERLVLLDPKRLAGRARETEARG